MSTIMKKGPQNFLDAYEQIEFVRAKTAAAEQVKIEAMKIKLAIREEAMERRKQKGEMLVMGEDGMLQLVSTNLCVESKPRIFTNMKNPELIKLIKQDDKSEIMYRIDCYVNGCRKEIYIDSLKAGDGMYLIRKFASLGIDFKIPDKEAKRRVRQMLCFLLEQSEREEALPIENGWMQDAEGKFKFIEEDEVTWKKAQRLAK